MFATQMPRTWSLTTLAGGQHKSTAGRARPKRSRLTRLPCAPAPQPIDQDLLRARHAAVVTVVLDRLLAHGRRGGCGPLFDAALAELDARLARCEGALPRRTCGLVLAEQPQAAHQDEHILLDSTAFGGLLHELVSRDWLDEASVAHDEHQGKCLVLLESLFSGCNPRGFSVGLVTAVKHGPVQVGTQQPGGRALPGLSRTCASWRVSLEAAAWRTTHRCSTSRAALLSHRS